MASASRKRAGSGRGSKAAMEVDTWWDANATASIVAFVSLADDTKFQLEVLFGLLDRSGDGIITKDDFMIVPPPTGRKTAKQATDDALLQREIFHRWDLLRQEFDFSNDNAIAPAEFVHGMKCAALKRPLDAASRLRPEARPDASHLEYLTLLADSVNATIKNLCKAVFDFCKSARADAQADLDRVSAQVSSQRVSRGLPPTVAAVRAPQGVEAMLALAMPKLTHGSSDSTLRSAIGKKARKH
jgi:hypothetical protein